MLTTATHPCLFHLRQPRPRLQTITHHSQHPDAAIVMTPPVDPRWLGSKLRAKLWREINSAGLGGLINRRLLLIVLRRRCKKPPRRSAAALNQFHGPFITGEIKPIFSFQFFTIIGPLLCHLSGCALAGDKDTSVYELWRPVALGGAVLSSSLLQPVAQTIAPPSFSVHREEGERSVASSRERDRDHVGACRTTF